MCVCVPHEIAIELLIACDITISFIFYSINEGLNLIYVSKHIGTICSWHLYYRYCVKSCGVKLPELSLSISLPFLLFPNRSKPQIEKPVKASHNGSEENIVTHFLLFPIICECTLNWNRKLILLNLSWKWVPIYPLSSFMDCTFCLSSNPFKSLKRHHREYTTSIVKEWTQSWRRLFVVNIVNHWENIIFQINSLWFLFHCSVCS